MDLSFLNSLLPIQKVKLNALFAQDSNTRFTQYARNEARGIATLQSLQTSAEEMIMKGKECAGIEVTWVKDCTPLKSSACEAPAIGCDVVAASTAESMKQSYNPNCPLSESFVVKDNLCDNVFTAAELINMQMAEAIKRLDVRLNRKFYIGLAANATPNSYPSSIGTIVGNVTNVPSGVWTDAFLVQALQEARYTGLKNPIFFDGMNMVTQKALSEFQMFNQAEGFGARIFDAFGGRLIFDDPTDAFAATGRNSTFIVDMDGIKLLTKVPDYGEQPIEIDASRNLYNWTQVSPMTGVRYLVRYQKTCEGAKDGSLEMATINKFSIHWLGDIVYAPVQCDGVGNVMEYVKIV